MELGTDRRFMLEALSIAQNAIYTSQFNPRVGCVIVKDNHIVASGYTQAPGRNHAEIQALDQAAEKGISTKDTTLYITLEPCSHYGRTPPCVDRIVAAQPKRVVIATLDPNPLVNGQGKKILEQNNILVLYGICEQEAIELNIGFMHRMRTKRPWVRLKIASSLDGRICLENGVSKWITGPKTRLDGQYYRARAGAIVSGIGTVLADDPQLNVRLPNLSPDFVQPLKVIVDQHLQTPSYAKLLHDQTAVLIAHQANIDSAKFTNLPFVQTQTFGTTDNHLDLSQIINYLGEQMINEVHLETGFRLSSAFIAQGLVDEYLLYLAPKIVGSGKNWVNLPPITQMNDTIALHLVDQTPLVNDDGQIDIRLIYRK